jgi:hypothetical protein
LLQDYYSKFPIFSFSNFPTDSIQLDELELDMEAEAEADAEAEAETEADADASACAFSTSERTIPLGNMDENSSR